ncbi:MAG: hypothetical protein WHU54_04730 [Candidatus Bathyarchaeia archaeon]
MGTVVKPDECFKIGHLREREVADILVTIYKNNPETFVYVLLNRYSLTGLNSEFKRLFSGKSFDNLLSYSGPFSDGKPRGDRFYVYRKGITIVVRPKNKALDVLVYKDGQRWSAWEITNYNKNSYIRWNKFRQYIKNLTRLQCHRFLVISYFENLRKAVDERKSKEWNIEEAQKILAKNKIFLIVWEQQHKLPEVKGWID